MFLKYSLPKVTYGNWMIVNVAIYSLKGTANYLRGHEEYALFVQCRISIFSDRFLLSLHKETVSQRVK